MKNIIKYKNNKKNKINFNKTNNKIPNKTYKFK